MLHLPSQEQMLMGLSRCAHLFYCAIYHNFVHFYFLFMIWFTVLPN